MEPEVIKKSRLSTRIKDKADLSYFEPTEFQQENKGDNKYIPNFYVVNSPSASTVIINLDINQSIFSIKGVLNYCDAGVKIETKTGGIFKGIARGLATSESMFMNYYTGTGKTSDDTNTISKNTENIVSFGGYLPGDIVGIEVKPNEKYTTSSNTFIAATSNLQLNTSSRFRNIIGGGGVFITQIVNESEHPGILWVSAFGGIEHLHIPTGTSMKIDDGLFVVAKSQYEYGISKAGGVKSFLLGGEGFVMDFKGPCDIYIQSRNIQNFIQYIKSHIGGGGNGSQTNQPSIGIDIGGSE